MAKVIINGNSYDVPENLTVIQACDMYGIQIPRFCYHEKLNVAGNCRMCLVELKGSPKLVPSCSTPVKDGMEVVTESNNIETARKSVLEVLLVNHPLDCPICDKGGECDLQDQTYRYGLDRSIINVDKRAVPEKNFGPFIKTYMTRCIHCTRCVRFATEIAGVEELGGVGRGSKTEIENYVEGSLQSELSGNIADVCPVGALTHSNYTYKARPWELISANTIDIMDAVGSNTRADCSPLSVLRILPRLNEEINEEWLADKSRYITDALRLQRIDKPIKRVGNKEFTEITWDEAFSIIKDKISKIETSTVASIAGDFVDTETMFAMKDLLEKLGSDKVDCRTEGYNFNPENKAEFRFNTKIENIEESDACLLIGCNPRKEAPILNARIRKRYLNGNYNIAVIGEKEDLNYEYNHLGNTSDILKSILDGKHEFAKTLKSAKNPMLIIGLGALQNKTYACEVLDICKEIAIKYNLINENWNGFNVLQTSASTCSGLEIGFTPKDKNFGVSEILKATSTDQVKVLWLLGADNIDFELLNKEKTFVVYQGHHGDKGALNADIILPGAIWLEKSSSYVNIEGRLQVSSKAIPTLGDAKEDWKIIRKLADELNIKVEYNTLAQLRGLISKNNPHLVEDEVVQASNFTEENIKKYTFEDINFNSYINNYYITDIISKNSLKMAESTALFANKEDI